VSLDDRELEDLRRAKLLLESPGLAARLTDLLGKPIERSTKLLPERMVATIHDVVRRSLESALDFAIFTMNDAPRPVSSDRMHKLATAASGAVGGLFGFAGLAVELPVTTTIMLRSIGDIARSEGHALSSTETRLACIEVFALGGPTTADDGSETGYYAVRATLSKLVADAAQHVTQKGVVGKGAPVLVRLINSVAARFGVVVEEKVALELIPVIGAVSGALINTLFMGHFQSAARGHFIVKRLEARHGVAVVREAYSRIEVPGR
jgi:hypothetical protein